MARRALRECPSHGLEALAAEVVLIEAKHHGASLLEIEASVAKLAEQMTLLGRVPFAGQFSVATVPAAIGCGSHKYNKWI